MYLIAQDVHRGEERRDGCAALSGVSKGLPSLDCAVLFPGPGSCREAEWLVVACYLESLQQLLLAPTRLQAAPLEDGL